MNLVEFFQGQSLQRNCSALSISTSNSSINVTPENSPRQEQMSNHDSQHIQNLTSLSPQISQMVPEEQQFPVDLTNYLSKRKLLMSWLKRNGSLLNISRNAEAAAQLYTDLYYHNNPYIRQQVQKILTCLLLLSTKHSDYKILFTNHLAYIYQLNQQQLNTLQMECCCRLGFQFSRDTYVMTVDRIVGKIRGEAGIDFYGEEQGRYVVLRGLHWVVEKVYVEVYQWGMEEEDVMEVFRMVLCQESKKYPQLAKFLARTEPPTPHQTQFQQTIQTFLDEWKTTKEQQVRELFRNRHKTQKYTDYAEFSVKYFN